MPHPNVESLIQQFSTYLLAGDEENLGQCMQTLLEMAETNPAERSCISTLCNLLGSFLGTSSGLPLGVDSRFVSFVITVFVEEKWHIHPEHLDPVIKCLANVLFHDRELVCHLLVPDWISCIVPGLHSPFRSQRAILRILFHVSLGQEGREYVLQTGIFSHLVRLLNSCPHQETVEELASLLVPLSKDLNETSACIELVQQLVDRMGSSTDPHILKALYCVPIAYYSQHFTEIRFQTKITHSTIHFIIDMLGRFPERKQLLMVAICFLVEFLTALPSTRMLAKTLVFSDNHQSLFTNALVSIDHLLVRESIEELLFVVANNDSDLLVALLGHEISAGILWRKNLLDQKPLNIYSPK